MIFEKRVATLLVILAFALALVGCGGTGSPTRTNVPPSTPPAAPTASLSASPTTVAEGGSTTLTWQTTNATTVSISGLGAVQPSGSQSVTPADSTTYTLTATGAGGTQTAAATVAVTAPPAPPPPPPTPPPTPTGGYTVTILQPLPGAAEAEATAINEAGVVVGYSVMENSSQPFFEATMWQNGVPSDLGLGLATAINSSNQVVGSFVDPNISVGADSGGADQGWFWSATTGRIVIGHLAQLGPDSVAAGIDADGTLVGQGFTNGTPAKEGLTWRMDLGINPVPGMNGIFAINSGFMAGQSDSGRAATVAVMEGQPTVTDLGADTDVQSMAVGVNRLGHVCGEQDTTDGNVHAFFWNQTFTDLGAAGRRYSSAFGINASDQIVGIMATPSSTGMVAKVQLKSWPQVLARLQAHPHTLDTFDRAMTWTQASGMIDLNTLVSSPDWTLSVANGINDKGEIVGSAFNQAQLNQAFVLEPK